MVKENGPGLKPALDSIIISLAEMLRLSQESTRILLAAINQRLVDLTVPQFRDIANKHMRIPRVLSRMLSPKKSRSAQYYRRPVSGTHFLKLEERICLDGVGVNYFMQYDDHLASMALSRLAGETSFSDTNFLWNSDLSSPFVSNVHDQVFVGSDFDDQFLIDLTTIAEGIHAIFIDGESGNDSLNLTGSEINFSTSRWMFEDGFGIIVLNSSSCYIHIAYRNIEFLITDVRS